MTERLRQMRRIANVRALEQQVREASCSQAQAHLQATLLSLEQAQQAAQMAVIGGAAALEGGDTGAWMLASAVREVAEWNLHQLRRQRLAKEAELRQKQLELSRSRMDLERCNNVLAKLEASTNAIEQRREQAASDDRFASRQHWARSMNSH